VDRKGAPHFIAGSRPNSDLIEPSIKGRFVRGRFFGMRILLCIQSPSEPISGSFLGDSKCMSS